MNCPLCNAGSSRSLVTKKRTFFVCDSCCFIWADPRSYLDETAERLRYGLHNNDRTNVGYVQFLTNILEQGLLRWKTLHHIDEPAVGAEAHLPLILDWGSGPNPVATDLLRERDFQVLSYDPIYGPQLPLTPQSFDIIFCIEVAEHFKNPLQDFNAMLNYLKPGGLLVFHTHIIPQDVFYAQALAKALAKASALEAFFQSWWYKEDPTHVSFYSEQAFKNLAQINKLYYEKTEKPGDKGAGKLHFFIKA